MQQRSIISLSVTVPKSRTDFLFSQGKDGKIENAPLFLIEAGKAPVTKVNHWRPCYYKGLAAIESKGLE